MPVESFDWRNLPLEAIDRVTFYKLDELTADLICCEIAFGEVHFTRHEEMDDWQALLSHPGCLPGFDRGWFAKVSQPPFATNSTVAFDRIKHD